MTTEYAKAIGWIKLWSTELFMMSQGTDNLGTIISALQAADQREQLNQKMKQQRNIKE